MRPVASLKRPERFRERDQIPTKTTRQYGLKQDACSRRASGLRYGTTALARIIVRKVAEFRDAALELELDLTRRAMTLLGNDQLA